jgi:hypothetical protein
MSLPICCKAVGVGYHDASKHVFIEKSEKTGKKALDPFRQGTPGHNRVAKAILGGPLSSRQFSSDRFQLGQKKLVVGIRVILPSIMLNVMLVVYPRLGQDGIDIVFVLGGFLIDHLEPSATPVRENRIRQNKAVLWIIAFSNDCEMVELILDRPKGTCFG